MLAVSASPAGTATVIPSAKVITRAAYDLDASQLRPLPSANDEARSVGSILGERATILIDAAATEDAVKDGPLASYRVVHFAVNGIPSTKFPARAALLLRPSDSDDGALQAREILLLRLNAALVTLSACDTGSGSVHGQDGPASLVRPFIASGARAVVANLCAADDTFSLTLMREFYRRVAAGADVLDTLRAPRQTNQKLANWRREAPIRPVVFEDAGVLTEDTVHLHLEQRVAQRLVARFRSQGYIFHDLSRACLAQVSDSIRA